jgi:tetratricopeptide (TPR) repeat protein
VLAITTGTVVTAWPTLHADFTSMRARYLVERWASGQLKPPTESAWSQARQALERASAITPGDPSLHERLGDLWVAAGLRDAADEALRSNHYEQALAAYQRVLAQRPRDAHVWVRVAAAHAGAGHAPQRMFEAWRKAQAFGPHEGHVTPMLAELAMMHWQSAPADVQDWLADLYERSAEPKRKALAKLGDRYGLAFEESPAAAEPTPASPPARQTPPVTGGSASKAEAVAAVQASSR